MTITPSSSAAYPQIVPQESTFEIERRTKEKDSIKNNVRLNRETVLTSPQASSSTSNFNSLSEDTTDKVLYYLTAEDKTQFARTNRFVNRALKIHLTSTPLPLIDALILKLQQHLKVLSDPQQRKLLDQEFARIKANVYPDSSIDSILRHLQLQTEVPLSFMRLEGRPLAQKAVENNESSVVSDIIKMESACFKEEHNAYLEPINAEHARTPVFGATRIRTIAPIMFEEDPRTDQKKRQIRIASTLLTQIVSEAAQQNKQITKEVSGRKKELLFIRDKVINTLQKLSYQTLLSVESWYQTMDKPPHFQNLLSLAYIQKRALSQGLPPAVLLHKKNTQYWVSLACEQMKEFTFAGSLATQCQRVEDKYECITRTLTSLLTEGRSEEAFSLVRSLPNQEGFIHLHMQLACAFSMHNEEKKALLIILNIQWKPGKNVLRERKILLVGLIKMLIENDLLNQAINHIKMGFMNIKDNGSSNDVIEAYHKIIGKLIEKLIEKKRFEDAKEMISYLPALLVAYLNSKNVFKDLQNK